jgi:uncharacterized lipoprotein
MRTSMAAAFLAAIALAGCKVEVKDHGKLPDVDVQADSAQVPNLKVPEIKTPDIKAPDVKMPDVHLPSVDHDTAHRPAPR